MLDDLEHLTLSGQGIDGSIPDSIGDLATLASLVLIDTSSSGRLPASIGGLSSLATMSITQSALIGPIPHRRSASSPRSGRSRFDRMS